MSEIPFITITPEGVVVNANETAETLAGIPAKILIGTPLLDHVDESHRARFESELASILNHDEVHGRVHLRIVGLDEIGRKLNMALTLQDDGNVHLDLSATVRESHTGYRGSNLADPNRLLPVARRIAAICRRAENRDVLLSDSLAVLAEALSATGAAAIDWGGAISGWPIAAMFGDFDEAYLKGVFRSSVIGRLTRGDVIVKEAMSDGTSRDKSLILVPLMATETPEGIVVLNVTGYTVLVPQEQQSLSLLGEMIGMGVRTLLATDVTTSEYQTHPADMESAIALGRLSAGLAHEINNAATILRNNVEQISADARRFARNSAVDTATRDSIQAVETIRDLTDALRAFAPEETRGLEKTDLIRVVEMVVSAVRFYAKRGIDVQVNRPELIPLMVECRSHYLIRALFLLFVELVESALASSRALMVDIAFDSHDKTIDLLLIVSAGPFNVTSGLLSQLERNGVLARHVVKAGATVRYDIHTEQLYLTIQLPRIAPAIRKSDPPAGNQQFPTKRGLILVVDDEPAIIRSTRRLLEQDHDVLAAKSGAEALESIKNNPTIDVILLDVFMPGMTGLDICEHLKRQNSPMADRLIFITGGATDQDVAKYLIQSNCPVLEKPIEIPALNRLISEMINH